MAERKRNWMWRRLEEDEARAQRRQRTVNYRRPGFMLNKHGQTVRHHAPHPTKAPIRRFFAMTKHVQVGDDYCLVWKGGDTFRVDDETVTTPARFYWQVMNEEKPGAHEALYRTCNTPRCVKHKEKR